MVYPRQAHPDGTNVGKCSSLCMFIRTEEALVSWLHFTYLGCLIFIFGRSIGWCISMLYLVCVSAIWMLTKLALLILLVLHQIYFLMCSSCWYTFFFYYQATALIQFSLSPQLFLISIMCTGYGVMNWYSCSSTVLLLVNNFLVWGGIRFGLVYLLLFQLPPSYCFMAQECLLLYMDNYVSFMDAAYCLNLWWPGYPLWLSSGIGTI